MSDSRARPHAAFRLNLEQQKKRAKELLKSAQSGDAAALARFAADGSASKELRLADAQRLIAHELGLSSWAELKTHIALLERAKDDVERVGSAPDADRATVHLRCGSDIRATLVAAGFRGDFLEHSYPYAHGPVTTTTDHCEREARFLAQHAGPHMALSFEDALAHRRREESALIESAERYERIVLWMEHDCFDQLVLIRCLAHYATLRARPSLELIETDRFPGATRFIGLGQLPEEALRLLWGRRRPVTPVMLGRATAAWHAVSSDDPRELAGLARTADASLPLLQPALRRLLQELPAVDSGTSLTERLVLEAISTASPAPTVQQVLGHLVYVSDPLPLATDFFLHMTIERLRATSLPPLTREVTNDKWRDRLTITDAGRRVLAGDIDLMSLHPAPRWVGGVEIRAGERCWRWDPTRDEVSR